MKRRNFLKSAVAAVLGTITGIKMLPDYDPVAEWEAWKELIRKEAAEGSIQKIYEFEVEHEFGEGVYEKFMGV